MRRLWPVTGFGSDVSLHPYGVLARPIEEARPAVPAIRQPEARREWSPALDCLEQYAASNQATPLYCLYNYSDHVDPMKHWHRCQRCFQAAELGCTVTPSANIRNSLNIRGMRDFDSVHTYPETVPWRCLAPCPRTGELLGLAQVNQTQGLARGSSPLFLQSPPRIYPELPGRLRSERQSDGPRRSREPIAIDELDLDFYDKNAGPPKRICLLETTGRDPASP